MKMKHVNTLQLNHLLILFECELQGMLESEKKYISIKRDFLQGFFFSFLSSRHSFSIVQKE
jgi:hypothetical protein